MRSSRMPHGFGRVASFAQNLLSSPHTTHDQLPETTSLQCLSGPRQSPSCLSGTAATHSKLALQVEASMLAL